MNFNKVIEKLLLIHRDWFEVEAWLSFCPVYQVGPTCWCVQSIFSSLDLLWSFVLMKPTSDSFLFLFHHCFPHQYGIPWSIFQRDWSQFPWVLWDNYRSYFAQFYLLRKLGYEFQWFFEFLRSPFKIIGNIFSFCSLINFIIFSLLSRRRDRSATWKWLHDRPLQNLWNSWIWIGANVSWETNSNISSISLRNNTSLEQLLAGQNLSKFLTIYIYLACRSYQFSQFMIFFDKLSETCE